jgi:hypothetical protein
MEESSSRVVGTDLDTETVESRFEQVAPEQAIGRIEAGELTIRIHYLIEDGQLTATTVATLEEEAELGTESWNANEAGSEPPLREAQDHFETLELDDVLEKATQAFADFDSTGLASVEV